MNVLKTILSFVKSIFSAPITQALIRAVLLEIIEERYGQVTTDNKGQIFSDVVDRLRQDGIDVKAHHALIATILDKELDIEIAKKEN